MIKLDRRQFLASLGAIGAFSPRKIFWEQQSSEPVLMLRPPCLQAMRPDGVTIVWSTSEPHASLEPGIGFVQYCIEGNAPEFVAARSRIFSPAETGMAVAYVQYEADLVGLTPGAE